MQSCSASYRVDGKKPSALSTALMYLRLHLSGKQLDRGAHQGATCWNPSVSSVVWFCSSHMTKVHSATWQVHFSDWMGTVERQGDLSANLMDLLPGVTGRCDALIYLKSTQLLWLHIKAPGGCRFKTGRREGLMSQAEEARALPPLLPIVVRNTRQHSWASQTPETRWRQVLLGGCELPAHVRPAGSALSNCPGIPDSREGFYTESLNTPTQTYSRPKGVQAVDLQVQNNHQSIHTSSGGH